MKLPIKDKEILKEKYRVKKIDQREYAVCYRDRYGRESIWVSCYLKENAKTICDILNTDRKDKVYKIKEERKCQNCANRFICPTYRENKCCDGYNDKSVFAGLLRFKLSIMPFDDLERIEAVERIQKGEDND